MIVHPTPSASPPRDDAELVEAIAGADHVAFEILMRRHNGKLFRVARAILKDDDEAEDALQDAYIDAYRHIDGFRGAAQVETWLTRIVINQALMRMRKQRRNRAILSFSSFHPIPNRCPISSLSN